MSTHQVRVGIVGGGLMGREFASAVARWFHLVDPPAIPRLVALCDPAPAAREWFAAQVPGIRAYANLDDLLNDEVDAAYAAVPHHLHHETYTQILRAGKHLLGEKPFGIDLAAAEAIQAEIDAQPACVVRCSSEFPYFPAAYRLFRLAESGAMGEILEVRAEFSHSSDLDPSKPINWKRRVDTCGEYGCMGDLGMHVCHVPFRLGWNPLNVRAILTRLYDSRPDGQGGQATCETWDNATLLCGTQSGFPMTLETKRISPGDTNTWAIRVMGSKLSAEFSTRFPKTLRTLPYTPGEPQAWRSEDTGSQSVYPTITGPIFEFGFSDALMQMFAAWLHEIVGGEPTLGCVRPEEALRSHRLFSAALRSHQLQSTERV
jgi:predicted dehydrogenase